MQRVSSQLTIFLRIALPTMWVTGVISFVIILFSAFAGQLSFSSMPFIWIGLLLILICGILFIKFFLWKFYRVDLDEEHLYVTNYFKTFRYALGDIDRITESTVVPGRIFCIHLKSASSFGQKIHFLASRDLWKDYLLQHPEWRAIWFQSVDQGQDK